MNIVAEDDDEELRPANLGPLYQNQLEDPKIARMMYDFYEDDTLPDLPEV